MGSRQGSKLLSGILSFRLAWLIFHSFILKLFKGPVISFSSLFLTFILMRCAMGLGVYPPAVRRRTKAAGDSSTAASPRTSSSPGKLSFQLSSSCTSFLFIYCAYAICRSPPRSVHREYRLCELICGGSVCYCSVLREIRLRIHGHQAIDGISL